MTIRFACSVPTCKAPLSAPDEKAGAKVRCPKCGMPCVIPGIQATAQPVPIVAAPIFFPPLPPRQATVPVAVSSWHPLHLVRLSVSPAFLSLAFLFLLFPCIEVRCSSGAYAGKTLLTQNGLQTTYGGYSVNQQLQALAEEQDRKAAREMTPREYAAAKKKGEKDKLQVMPAPLMILFYAALFGAIVACGASAWLEKYRLPLAGVAGTCTASAFLFLSIQMAAGFPLEKAVAEQLSKGDGGRGAEPALAVALMFDTHFTPWLWLAWLALPLATGGLAWAVWPAAVALVRQWRRPSLP